MAGALAGLKVIDCTRVLGGPFCTQWLGDHGAEVIKIEPPQGDEVRTWGPPFDGDGTASYFLGVNRNKAGVALDLSQPAGREVLLRLLDDADVLIENFKTGTLEKWGIGYDQTLSVRFPRLVHCRISGFGADGPLGGLPGYDAIVQAFAGMMSVNGTPETGPTRLGTPIVDMATGISAGFGVLAALLERQMSGRGQFLEVSLYDTAVSLLHPQAANYFLSGKRPVPQGNAHPNITPYDQFPTRTCAIFIGCGNDRQFVRLMERLGQPGSASDPRFATMGARNENRVALRAILEPLLAVEDGEALADDLMRRGVPAGPVLGIPEVVAHPHAQARDMVVSDGDYRGTGNPIKYGRTPAEGVCKPPQFGADTRAVLTAAGYTADEIDALVRDGIALDGMARQAAE